MRKAYSVSQVNAYIKHMFSEDYLLRSLLVRGEVSNCKYHSSGHIYFTLKDASGTLACVMFAGRRRGLSFLMKEGDQVIVSGTVDVYERDGRYQLYAMQIIRDGVGALNERYEQLKRRLEEQGMFDERYKQAIPAYIRTLGVVTAPTGAAVRDIINIAHRRNPYVKIILYPAIVQGDQAADSIITGIHALEDLGVDTIIIGRGGGSIEDLWAFNEEKVAQAVFDCAVPVISAVGHETDTVITDYVADLRAPTPSAAAELAVYDYERFRDDMEAFYNSLNQSMQYRLDRCREKTRTMQLQLQHLSPAARIRQQRTEAARYADRLQARMRMRLADSRARLRIGDSLTYSMNRRLSGTKHRMQVLAARMEALSPLARLSGGYGSGEKAYLQWIHCGKGTCSGSACGTAASGPGWRRSNGPRPRRPIHRGRPDGLTPRKPINRRSKMPRRKKTEEVQAQQEAPQEQELTIEETFERLQALLARMEEEDVSLEESFDCYEQGMKLLRACNDKIDRVEQKVLKLSEDGSLEEF